MQAYGQTSDSNSGLLHESWGCGSLTTEIAVNSREEYGWQEPNQQIIEFIPPRNEPQVAPLELLRVATSADSVAVARIPSRCFWW